MLTDWEREVRFHQAMRLDALTPAAEARCWRRRALALLVVAVFAFGMIGFLLAVCVGSGVFAR